MVLADSTLMSRFAVAVASLCALYCQSLPQSSAISSSPSSSHEFPTASCQYPSVLCCILSAISAAIYLSAVAVAVAISVIATYFPACPPASVVAPVAAAFAGGVPAPPSASCATLSFPVHVSEDIVLTSPHSPSQGQDTHSRACRWSADRARAGPSSASRSRPLPSSTRRRWRR